jgi:hypothetical protein
MSGVDTATDSTKALTKIVGRKNWPYHKQLVHETVDTVATLAGSPRRCQAKEIPLW